MASGTITVTGLSASEPAGEREFGPLTIVGTQVIGETLAVPLAQGDNTFSVPAASVAALIIAPANGAANLTLRTNLNSGDAGLPFNGVGAPFVYPFGSSTPSSFIINSSAAQSAPLTIAFI